MTEFDYDVKSRKALVPSARRRKCGSKSKKCTLPMDYKTKGELNKLNGDVISISMNKPYDINTLFKASRDVQIEYIQNLRTQYRASTRMLSTVLGVSQPTILRYLHSLGISHDRDTAPHPRKIDRVAFERFLKQEDATPVEVVEVEEEEVESAHVANANEDKVVKPVVMSGWNGLVPDMGDLEYSGTVREICEALVYTLGADSRMNITVRFNKEVELKCSGD